MLDFIKSTVSLEFVESRNQGASSTGKHSSNPARAFGRRTSDYGESCCVGRFRFPGRKDQGATETISLVGRFAVGPAPPPVADSAGTISHLSPLDVLLTLSISERARASISSGLSASIFNHWDTCFRFAGLMFDEVASRAAKRDLVASECAIKRMPSKSFQRFLVYQSIRPACTDPGVCPH